MPRARRRSRECETRVRSRQAPSVADEIQIKNCIPPNSSQGETNGVSNVCIVLRSTKVRSLRTG